MLCARRCFTQATCEQISTPYIVCRSSSVFRCICCFFLLISLARLLSKYAPNKQKTQDQHKKNYNLQPYSKCAGCCRVYDERMMCDFMYTSSTRIFDFLLLMDLLDGGVIKAIFVSHSTNLLFTQYASVKNNIRIDNCFWMQINDIYEYKINYDWMLILLISEIIRISFKISVYMSTFLVSSETATVLRMIHQIFEFCSLCF